MPAVVETIFGFPGAGNLVIVLAITWIPIYLRISPSEITGGFMVSRGRACLTTAWWLSIWPGLAIGLATLSLNLLSTWRRTALDPVQRWRLEISRKGK